MEPSEPKPAATFERETKEKPLSPAERVQLVQKYLTPEGKELFAEICLKLLPPIVGKIIGGTYPDSVDDVVQVAILKATLNLRKFNGEAALQGWLFRIATNETIDLLRMLKRHEEISQADSIEELQSKGEDVSEPSAVQNALINADMLSIIMESLDEHQQNLLILKEVEGYSIKEIASMLDMEENTVKVHLFRARNTARKYAQEKGLNIVKE